MSSELFDLAQKPRTAVLLAGGAACSAGTKGEPLETILKWGLGTGPQRNPQGCPSGEDNRGTRLLQIHREVR